MKAAIHPDKGGEPAPVLALPPSRSPASISALHRLNDLRVYVERELAAGPSDDWDGAVLDQWREIVMQKIRDAEMDLIVQLHPNPDYIIVESA